MKVIELINKLHEFDHEKDVYIPIDDYMTDFLLIQSVREMEIDVYGIDKNVLIIDVQ